MPRLRTAVQTVLADREWWRKALVGGLLWLSLVGWPIVEGYQLESIENSQRGFPTPLPRWYAFADKMVVGIFALLIDFFFFVFPVLLGGMVLFCGVLTIGLSGNQLAARASLLAGPLLIGLYVFVAWLSGASAVARQRYVLGGDLQQALSAGLIRELFRAPARGPYLRARLESLPPYLLASMLLILGVLLMQTAWLGGLIVLWLGVSSVLVARLITIQLYLAATRQVERIRFDLPSQLDETYRRPHS